MSGLIGKRIVLGISGGISAYKTLDLIRRLKALGLEVRVIMTESAKKFVTSFSLRVISSYPVFSSFFDNLNKKGSISHIELARWADLVLLAPATANLLAKLSVGLSDDLLSSLCLATTAPIAVAPSMNQRMYNAIVTQKNLDTLRRRGILIWGPEYGIQACDDIGYGRMVSPEGLVRYVNDYFLNFNVLNNLNILITAGPTREFLDPIRFFSNKSSGKMGFAIAEEASSRGAKVTLVSGPVDLKTPLGIYKRINVISALEMRKIVMKNIRNQQIFIGCAAVSDYRVCHIFFNKIKKNRKSFRVIMTRNPDIISEVGFLTENRPYVVGFSADVYNIEICAEKKRIKKNIDLICANDVSSDKQGFNSDYNSLHLFWNNGSMVLPLNEKRLLAQQLMNEIINRYNEKNKY